MLTPMTPREISSVVKNVLAACKDITKLNKKGYNFLYLASGFIAHYNLEGFISYYTDVNLVRDIIRNKDNNQWGNFREGDRDYHYNMAKKDCYNAICEGIDKG